MSEKALTVDEAWDAYLAEAAGVLKALLRHLYEEREAGRLKPDDPTYVSIRFPPKIWLAFMDDDAVAEWIAE